MDKVRYMRLGLQTVFVLVASTVGVFAANMQTKSGRYLMNYSISQLNKDLTLSVFHEDGVVKVPLSDLPDEIARPYIRKAIEQSIADAKQKEDPDKKIRILQRLMEQIPEAKEKVGDLLEKAQKEKAQKDKAAKRSAADSAANQKNTGNRTAGPKKSPHAVITTAEGRGSAELNRGNQLIQVRADGQGLNYQEALEDAFRNAIRKAVGVFVVAQTKMRNDDLVTEEICLNADAVISMYREVSRSESHGLINLTLDATVIRNALLEKMQKVRADRITSGDIANLINRRKALANAEKSLEYIFQDIGLKIYNSHKIGNFSVAEDDDLDSHQMKLRVHYEINFDFKAYYNFERCLMNLLKQVSIAEISGNASFSKLRSTDDDNPLLLFEQRKRSFPKGTTRIIFFDEYKRFNKLISHYQVYWVPKQIVDKIKNLLNNDERWEGLKYNNTLVFQFETKNSQTIIEKSIKDEFVFWHYYTYFVDDKHTLVFRNGFLKARRPEEVSYTIKADATFSFTEEQIRPMKSCTLKYHTGIYAPYIHSLLNDDHYIMRTLAGGEDYIPAMIALAKDDPDWYHIAALYGSQHAQQKINWKNGGLGFTLARSYNRQYVVQSSSAKSPVKRGMALTKINDKDLSDMGLKDLTKYIGDLAPGESVELFFDDQKKIVVNVLEKYK